MRKLLLSLAALAAFSPFSALAYSVQQHEVKTNLAHDFRDGKLDAKILDNYTLDWNPPVFEQYGYEANMRALRRYTHCFFNQTECKADPMEY